MCIVPVSPRTAQNIIIIIIIIIIIVLTIFILTIAQLFVLSVS